MPQTSVQSAHDVVEFLKNQHNVIKDMFDEVLHASGTGAREKAFLELRRLLAVHETAEEMVVHPRRTDRGRPQADGRRGARG